MKYITFPVCLYFFTNFSFQIYSQPQKTSTKTTTRQLGNSLKLDLSELANQKGALVVRWDLWLTG